MTEPDLSTLQPLHLAPSPNPGDPDRIVPRELEQEAQAQGVAVHVNLVDKRQEEYQAPPPPPYVAYSGEGKTAG